MKRLGKVVGATASASLLLGLYVGSLAPARASTLPLLQTNTVLSAQFDPVLPGMTDLTATVTLALVNGLLVSPSGIVNFSESEDGETTGLGGATLSACLLGLPAISGLTQATCSATIQLPSDYFDCFTTASASYSGDTDLLALPSVGTTGFSDDC
jgi:hypothetical protein